jgi:hypothetical protein
MEFIETTIFKKSVSAWLSDDEFHQLQMALALRPDAGAVKNIKSVG